MANTHISFTSVDAIGKTPSSPINTNLESPATTDYELINKKNFWKTSVEYTDELYMYQRKGVAYRVINKEISLLFKNGFTINNEVAEQIRADYKLDEVVKLATKYAEIGGFSLIYVDYGDITSQFDYDTPAPNTEPVGFFVISKGWIFEDVYRDQREYDNYVLRKATGETISVHKSRICRVRLNDEEISRIKPAYDSLQVLDNVLWGMGQTMFRSGTGFPVMKIKDGSKQVAMNGTTTTRIKQAKNSGIMQDFNSETGFIIDADDDISFKGAEGKAIRPEGYYDKTFQQVAVDLGFPTDILKGVSAGEVTGSETNLREFYSDLHAKQEQQIKPIYNKLFKLFNIDDTSLLYSWNKIWELSQKEVAENLKIELDIWSQLISANLATREQAHEYLVDNYSHYKFKEFPLPVETQSQTIELPSIENVGGDDTSQTNSNLSLPHVRGQYAMSDKQVTDALQAADQEKSALPKELDRVEKSMRKEFLKIYSDMTDEILEVSQRLN